LVSGLNNELTMPKTVQQILITPPIGGFGEQRDWVLQATDEQLDEYLSLISGNESLHRIAIAERQRRHFAKLSKPHWSLTPGFIVGVFAMVFAAIASWPVIREWIQSSQRVSKDSNSQLIQSNSMPVTPPTLQKSPPTTNAAPNTNLLKK
jgi:hypothetical protein